jgi:hypothetical protein
VYEKKALLKDFMEACDMVKFAKHMPVSEETEAIYSTAKRFVEDTSVRV